MDTQTLSADPLSMLDSTRSILAYVNEASDNDDPVLVAHTLLVASRSRRRLAAGSPTSSFMIRADDSASLLLALLELAHQDRLVLADVSLDEVCELRDALSCFLDG